MTSTLDRERLQVDGERRKANGISLAAGCREDLIAADSVAKSDRPSRHRGYVTRWRRRDRDKAVTLRKRIQQTFDEKSSTVAAAEPKQLHLPHFNEGTQSDGKAQ